MLVHNFSLNLDSVEEYIVGVPVRLIGFLGLLNEPSGILERWKLDLLENCSGLPKSGTVPKSREVRED